MLSLRLPLALASAVAACAAAVLVAPPARAEGAAAPAPETKTPVRRRGLVVGASLGLGVSSVAGYPNDVTKEGFARYYTVTGVKPSDFAELWIGAAFTDWLVFGLGVGGGRLLAETPSSSKVFLFHVEAYPLFALGGRFHDLGVMADFGTGPISVTAPDDSMKLVDGGAASFLGGGVFYEGLRAWKTSSGPFLSGNYFWSDTVRRPGIFLGWRIALASSP